MPGRQTPPPVREVPPEKNGREPGLPEKKRGEKKVMVRRRDPGLAGREEKEEENSFLPPPHPVADADRSSFFTGTELPVKNLCIPRFFSSSRRERRDEMGMKNPSRPFPRPFFRRTFRFFFRFFSSVAPPSAFLSVEIRPDAVLGAPGREDAGEIEKNVLCSILPGI